MFIKFNIGDFYDFFNKMNFFVSHNFNDNFTDRPGCGSKLMEFLGKLFASLIYACQFLSRFEPVLFRKTGTATHFASFKIQWTKLNSFAPGILRFFHRLSTAAQRHNKASYKLLLDCSYVYNNYNMRTLSNLFAFY